MTEENPTPAIPGGPRDRGIPHLFPCATSSQFRSQPIHSQFSARTTSSTLNAESRYTVASFEVTLLSRTVQRPLAYDASMISKHFPAVKADVLVGSRQKSNSSLDPRGISRKDRPISPRFKEPNHRSFARFASDALAARSEDPKISMLKPLPPPNATIWSGSDTRILFWP